MLLKGLLREGDAVGRRKESDGDGTKNDVIFGVDIGEARNFGLCGSGEVTTTYFDDVLTGGERKLEVFSAFISFEKFGRGNFLGEITLSIITLFTIFTCGSSGHKFSFATS